MADENTGLPNVEKTEKSPQVPVKPLPQVLAEIEDNIRTAINAAKKAEEAAKLAKQASAATAKAAGEAVKRAEETRQAGNKYVQNTARVSKESADKAGTDSSSSI